LRVKLTRDHISAIGGITPEGRIFMQMQDHSYKGPDVVRFLQLLLREIPGKILVIWDGASIHKSLVIKDFLKKGGAKRIQIERLPAYAPELNPQEGVWNLLKRVQLKNVCCLHLDDLQEKLLHAKERLRHHKYTLSQCYAHAGYQL
jgi:transposase